MKFNRKTVQEPIEVLEDDSFYNQEEDEEFQEHDGGIMFGKDGLIKLDCECGEQGEWTNDLAKAYAERAAHEKEMQDQK